MKKRLLILPILLLSLFCQAQQPQLEVNGNVNFDNSVFSINEAGLDFAASLETQTSILLSVFQDGEFTKKNDPNNKWRIAVFKHDLHDESYDMEIRRTGIGNNVGNQGKPKVNGGENYQIVQNTEQLFFTGRGEIRDIPVQLKLSGISIVMGANLYNSKLVFTVYEGW